MSHISNLLLSLVKPNKYKIIVLFFILLSGIFYWYELRPANIRHECSWVSRHEDAIPAYEGESEEHFQKSKDELSKEAAKCDDTGLCWAQINLDVLHKEEARSARPAKDWWQPATTKEYDFCIHEKGL